MRRMCNFHHGVANIFRYIFLNPKPKVTDMFCYRTVSSFPKGRPILNATTSIWPGMAAFSAANCGEHLWKSMCLVLLNTLPSHLMNPMRKLAVLHVFWG